MKAEYLSCLVESVSEIFSAMLNSETTSGSVMMTSRRNSEKSVGAHIFFFGPADGVVMLSFPVNTATNVARALTCTEGTIPREMLEDCVVELVGILAARSTFRDLASSPVRIGEPSYEDEENEGGGSPSACARSSWCPTKPVPPPPSPGRRYQVANYIPDGPRSIRRRA